MVPVSVKVIQFREFPDNEILESPAAIAFAFTIANAVLERWETELHPSGQVFPINWRFREPVEVAR